MKAMVRLKYIFSWAFGVPLSKENINTRIHKLKKKKTEQNAKRFSYAPNPNVSRI